MFAIDHATTALLVKRRYPSVPMTPLLVSVQAMELAWVGLNYLGIERTTTETTVRSVADIHLAYMPYSHSVGTAVGAAVLVWLIIEKGFDRAALGRAIGLGIVSHLILDLATRGRAVRRVRRRGSLRHLLLARLPRGPWPVRSRQPRQPCELVDSVGGYSGPGAIPGWSPDARCDFYLRADRGDTGARQRACASQDTRIDCGGTPSRPAIRNGSAVVKSYKRAEDGYANTKANAKSRRTFYSDVGNG